MNKFLSYLSIVCTMLIVSSCGSDDTENPTDQTNEVAETITLLTNNSQKSWRIRKAVLANTVNASSIDISNAFNIKDDVFVFSTETVDNPDLTGVNGSIVWKQREGVNWNASSLAEVYKDFYEKEIEVGFQVSEENTAVFRAFAGLFDFTISDENTITGKIQVSDNNALEITLTPLLDTDLPVIPASLSFKEVTTLELNPSGTNTLLGLIGSKQSNVLYISRRVRFPLDPCNTNVIGLDEVATYDLTSNAFDTKTFCQGSGLSTKEIEVINGKLIVSASDSNNIYDLNLNSDPSVSQHDEFLTRFGTAAFENDVYITGSKFSVVEGTVEDQLFRFNIQSKALEVFETLPVPKVWADVEVVDDKLYIFGGQDSSFDNNIGTDDILIYDFDLREWQTLKMSKAVNDTFTGKYHNLIFVGGNIFIDNDGDGNQDSTEDFLGVYNTLDSTFTEINFEFDTPQDGIFRQLTVLNNKIYLVTSASLSQSTFKLYEAELK